MEAATAAMLGIERGMPPFGLVVSKVAVNDEVIGILGKLRAPRQHGPGKT